MDKQKTLAALLASGSLLLSASVAFAADNDNSNLLEDEPAVAQPQRHNAAPDKEQSPVTSSMPSNDYSSVVTYSEGKWNDHGKIMIGGFGGPQWNNYTLSGGGFTTTLPRTTGAVYGGEARYKDAASIYSVGARFTQSSTTNNSLPNVTPGSISTKRSQTYVDVTLYPIPKNDNIGLMVGYAFTYRTSTATAPNQVLSNYSASGPLLGVAYAPHLTGAWNLDSRVDVYFPAHYNETNTTTGYLNTVYGGDIEVGAFYALTSSIALGVNVDLHMESTTFTGTGSRGTINGSEKDWSYGLPVELRVIF